MNGKEFIRKIKKLGKAGGVPVELDESRGKGSPTLYYGTAFTIVRNLKDELKTGPLHDMLPQLGLTKDDLK